MQKLQEFINNTLLFAQAVGAHIANLRSRVYNLELLNLNPVQYINQIKSEKEKAVARKNIGTNAVFMGSVTPDSIDWSALYPGLILRDGDRYIQQDFSNSLRTEYTYYTGNNEGVNAEWVKINIENFVTLKTDNEVDENWSIQRVDQGKIIKIEFPTEQTFKISYDGGLLEKTDITFDGTTGTVAVNKTMNDIGGPNHKFMGNLIRKINAEFTVEGSDKLDLFAMHIPLGSDYPFLDVRENDTIQHWLQAAETFMSNLSNVVNQGIKTPSPLDCSGNPNYPATEEGESYKVTVAGKIGGPSGLEVEVGDMIICSETNSGGNQSTVGSNYFILQTNLDQATESIAGFAKISTNALVDGKTNDNTIITPKKLEYFKNNLITWLETNKFVRFDSSQGLDNTAKTTSRNNIGAADDTTVVKLSGNQTIGGTKIFSTIPVLPNSDPSSDNQAARKKYVDGKFNSTAKEFTELTDTPNDYTGYSNFLVKVNKGEDGLVFVEDTSKVKSMQIALTPRGEDLVEHTMVFEFTVLKKMQITSYPVLGVIEAPTGESILLSIAKNNTFIGVMNPFLEIIAGNKYSTNPHDIKDTIFDVGDKMSFFLNKVGAIVPGSGMDIYWEYVEL